MKSGVQVGGGGISHPAEPIARLGWVRLGWLGLVGCVARFLRYPTPCEFDLRFLYVAYLDYLSAFAKGMGSFGAAVGEISRVVRWGGARADSRQVKLGGWEKWVPHPVGA